MQQVIKGIASLPDILKGVACGRLFMVVDSSYPSLGVRDAIEALAVEKVRFSDFTPNPLYEQVCKGEALLRESRCDTILAVGGGSAMDVAKCIKLAVLAAEGSAALIPPLVARRLPIDGGRIPLVAIPTTAGSGSESTHNAVMYYMGAKQTVTNDGVLPDYAILEPRVLKTLPLYQKKSTMLDALCQGIESMWSVGSTDESMVYSQRAIRGIMDHWRDYTGHSTAEAAEAVMDAANYAGRAINIAETTAPHAMSYKLTSMYGIPHGHAVALCLPEVWSYMLSHPERCIDPRGREHLGRVFGMLAALMGCNTEGEAVSRFKETMRALDMPSTVRSASRVADVDVLSRSVNPVRLKNNPVHLTDDAIRQIYSNIIL